MFSRKSPILNLGTLRQLLNFCLIIAVAAAGLGYDLTKPVPIHAHEVNTVIWHTLYYNSTPYDVKRVTENSSTQSVFVTEHGSSERIEDTELEIRLTFEAYNIDEFSSTFEDYLLPFTAQNPSSLLTLDEWWRTDNEGHLYHILTPDIISDAWKEEHLFTGLFTGGGTDNYDKRLELYEKLLMEIVLERMTAEHKYQIYEKVNSILDRALKVYDIGSDTHTVVEAIINGYDVTLPNYDLAQVMKNIGAVSDAHNFEVMMSKLSVALSAVGLANEVSASLIRTMIDNELANAEAEVRLQALENFILDNAGDTFIDPALEEAIVNARDAFDEYDTALHLSFAHELANADVAMAAASFGLAVGEYLLVTYGEAIGAHIAVGASWVAVPLFVSLATWQTIYEDNDQARSISLAATLEHTIRDLVPGISDHTVYHGLILYNARHYMRYYYYVEFLRLNNGMLGWFNDLDEVNAELEWRLSSALSSFDNTCEPYFLGTNIKTLLLELINNPSVFELNVSDSMFVSNTGFEIEVRVNDNAGVDDVLLAVDSGTYIPLSYNPSEDTYTTWWDTSGIAGSTHDLNIRVLDDDGNEVHLLIENVVVNDFPSLTDPVISPGPIGDASTNFQFFVTFTDADNDHPDSVTVVVDSTEYSMSSSDTTYDDGAIFASTPRTFSTGVHNYYFKATQGTWTGREPASVSYQFEVIASANGLTLSSDTYSIPLDGSSEAHLIAHVTDGQGNPVVGELVTFGTDYTGSLYPHTDTTDANGDAHTTFTPSEVGDAIVSASTGGGLSDQVTIDVYQSSGAIETTFEIHLRSQTDTQSRYDIDADSRYVSSGEPVEHTNIEFTVLGESGQPFGTLVSSYYSTQGNPVTDRTNCQRPDYLIRNRPFQARINDPPPPGQVI